MVVYAICICLFGFSLCAGFTLGWFGTVGTGPSVLIVFRGLVSCCLIVLLGVIIGLCCV